MVERITSKDGTPIACQRSGGGPPLVLVHGAVADHTRWQPVLAPLEQRFTVYAMDRRGRGGSGDTEPYAIEREFEDVAAVVDACSEPASLLGHSFGAFCSLEAARLTSNIRRLALYEPPDPGVKGTLPPAVEARMQALLEAGDRGSVVATFLREVAQVPSNELELLRASPAWPGRAAAAHTILREIHCLEGLPPFEPARYAALTMPALLLLGGASHPAYGEAIRKVQAALPNSRLAVLPGQQHVAMNTAPELFVREVLKFFAD